MLVRHAHEGGTVQLHGPVYLGNETRSQPKTPSTHGEGLSLSLPTHVLMATGGAIRLRTDPETLLNGYGCSHRPRPWAITFASSTASSVSERGYMAADAAPVSYTHLILSHEASRGKGLEIPDALKLLARLDLHDRIDVYKRQLLGHAQHGVEDQQH